MPPNPLYRAKDPVNALRQLASDTPEYQELTNYLMARNAMPEVKFGYMDEGKNGEFDRNTKFIGGGSKHPAGTVSLNDTLRRYEGDPRQAVSTLGHELTHAAWNQMRQQIHEGKVTPEFADAFSKLVYNMQEGVWSMPALQSNPDASLFNNPWAASRLAEKIDPEWARKNRGYRASSNELPAFAIGNMVNPSPPGWTPPAHLDSTLATEFRILQELAQRDAVKNPNKVNR